MTRTLPYTLITTFSNSLTGGNPAAVIFLADTSITITNDSDKDTNSVTDIPDDATLQATANNLNQPIVSYITGSLPTAAPRSAAFGIRWFALRETPLCGHGTIAAAKAIWNAPGMVDKDIKTLEFHAKSGEVLKVSKEREGEVGNDDAYEEWLKTELPAGTVEPVDDTEKKRIAELTSEAIGKEAHVKFVGHGGNGFEYMILIELDVADDLENCQVDSTKLRDSGKYVNILTTASPNDAATFHLRMFAPFHLSNEDPVCGSAHCIVAPYWSAKLGKCKENEMQSKQVSSRGGDLRVVWDEEGGVVRLKGQLFI